MGTEAFSVRADAKKVAKLDRLAKQLERSRNYVVNQAIDHLLDLHALQDERIKDGIRAAEANEFASDTEVHRILSKYKSGQ